MPFIDTCAMEGPAPPATEDIDLAVGEGVAAGPNEDSRSWLPIEEICNGEWSIGGRR